MVTDSVVRLEFRSHFDMLDFVQVVSEEMGRLVGLDDDSTHWVSVAVRESVINAIKHGNREVEEKRVTVEFTLTGEPSRLTVRVVDQGEGFDPVELADPLAPENLLKSSGRGIFFMRNFMDDLTLPARARRRHGGRDGQDGRRRQLLGFPARRSPGLRCSSVTARLAAPSSRLARRTPRQETQCPILPSGLRRR